MEVKCDKCGYDFKIKSYLHEEIDTGVIKYYFCCLECGEKYDVFYENEEVRELIRERQEIDELFKKAVRNQDGDGFEELVEELDLVKSEIKVCQDSLRFRYNVLSKIS